MRVITVTMVFVLFTLISSTSAIIETYIPPGPSTLEEKVELLARKNNLDSNVMLRIIKCESSNNPFAIRENYRKGKLWSKDIGYFQINDYYWQEFFKKQGLDIYKPNDNLLAGVYIMKKQGTTPWNWSKHCWK